jgi:geranylgeranyl pyrophosphate synthase
MSASSSINGSLREAFEAGLPLFPETESHLRDALLQTLHRPGSMVRAQMVFEMATHYGLAAGSASQLAIAVEYFHTASLIFDDLPCMDDAATRRGEPCIHRTHGEATAILAGLGLVNRAYALAWQAIQTAPAEHRPAAGRYLEKCLGVAGVLNGQSQVLHYATLPQNARTPQTVALGKTVSLIQLSLVLPALLAGASETEQQLLERLARFWGLSYQIIDDLKDRFSRSELTGKTAARDELLHRPNAVLQAGARPAFRRLKRLLRLGDCALNRLSACRPGLPFLHQLRTRFAEEMAVIQPMPSA